MGWGYGGGGIGFDRFVTVLIIFDNYEGYLNVTNCFKRIVLKNSQHFLVLFLSQPP